MNEQPLVKFVNIFALKFYAMYMVYVLPCFWLSSWRIHSYVLILLPTNTRMYIATHNYQLQLLFHSSNNQLAPLATLDVYENEHGKLH